MVNYPIISNKYVDALPLEIETYRHFWTSKMISEPVRIFLNKITYFYLYRTLYIYIYIHMVNYPIFTKKYIDCLPIEIDTHRHFGTSNNNQ